MWGHLLTFWVGKGQKKLFRSWKVFFGCLVALAMLLLSLAEKKNYSACEKFFLTHSGILLWPHSIRLRVRVAQCAMALRVMVQSHLGWPWEYHKSPDTSFGTIHHSWWVCSARWMAPGPATVFFVTPSCARPATARIGSRARCLCHIAQLHAAGNRNIPNVKPVAGRMPSILHSILIQNGAKPDRTSIRKAMAHECNPPTPQPNAVGPKKYAKKISFSQADFFPSGPDESIATATTQPERTFSLWKAFFGPSSTPKEGHQRDVLGEGTSPGIPKSRINEVRSKVRHTN